MSSYLHQIAARSLNLVPAVRPRLASRFEPPAGQLPVPDFAAGAQPELAEGRDAADWPAIPEQPVDRVRTPFVNTPPDSTPHSSPLPLESPVRDPKGVTIPSALPDTRIYSPPAPPTTVATNFNTVVTSTPSLPEERPDVSSLQPIGRTTERPDERPSRPARQSQVDSESSAKTAVTNSEAPNVSATSVSNSVSPPSPPPLPLVAPPKDASNNQIVDRSINGPSPLHMAPLQVSHSVENVPPLAPLPVSPLAPRTTLNLQNTSPPPAPPPPPTIQVTIGRIDVRAIAPQQPPPKPPRPRQKKPSLEEYLRKKNGASALRNGG